MTFGKQVWNVKETYKPQEIKEKIESFNLKGRVIKDIKAVGMDYAHGEVDVEDAVDYLFETYYPEALDDNSAYNMFIDDLPFRRYMEIDQPFIIKFDNNETFEIVADWSPYYDFTHVECIKQNGDIAEIKFKELKRALHNLD